MPTYLVTGGCGFIGSHLIESLLSGGHQVGIIDNLSTGKQSNIPSHCELVISDIVDDSLVRECTEGCFHLAARPLTAYGSDKRRI
ncbi:MAG: UDP-glucose 4-epimerase [Porticoccaceae bacterium]|jgi:UDP-glucose 4-epimerase